MTCFKRFDLLQYQLLVQSMPYTTKNVSFRGPLGSLQASPNSTETKQARSTLFSLLFFSSPSLEPSRARLEASVHSSLDLKHSTA